MKKFIYTFLPPSLSPLSFTIMAYRTQTMTTTTTTPAASLLLSKNRNAKVGGEEDRFITICASCDQEQAQEVLNAHPEFINVRVIRGSLIVTPLMSVIHSNMSTNTKKLDMIDFLLAQPDLKLGRLDEVKRTDVDHAILASPYLRGLLTRLLAHPTCVNDLINYNSTRFCSLLSLASGDSNRLEEFLNACIENDLTPDFYLIPHPKQFAINTHHKNMSVLNIMRFKTGGGGGGSTTTSTTTNARAHVYKHNLDMVHQYLAILQKEKNNK